MLCTVSVQGTENPRNKILDYHRKFCETKSPKQSIAYFFLYQSNDFKLNMQRRIH